MKYKLIDKKTGQVIEPGTAVSEKMTFLYVTSAPGPGSTGKIYVRDCGMEREFFPTVVGAEILPESTLAYCDRSGIISTTRGYLPEGMLPIARATDPAKLQNVLDATSRLAHDNTTALVPGIPEAGGDTEAYDAYLKYTGWLKERNYEDVEIL